MTIGLKIYAEILVEVLVHSVVVVHRIVVVPVRVDYLSFLGFEKINEIMEEFALKFSAFKT